MRTARHFSTSGETAGLFPKNFALKPPAQRMAKPHLSLHERLAVFSAVRTRGSSPESVAAAFGVSLATVLRVVNLAVSEEFDGSLMIKPTSDGDAGGAQ